MSILHEILQRYWRYESFRPLQEDIIQSVLDGKDTLGLMPTGGGKSLTFQVPALATDGICLVITPLIALMKDQVDALRSKGIKATYIHSGMSHAEIITALENCVFGNYKFLYVSPERLDSELFLSRVIHMPVNLIAVDEAHCISQWGYDFRPAYLKISDLRKLFPKIPILALTATATKAVVDDIQDKLCFTDKNVFRKSFERKNLTYVIRETVDKLSEIVHILDKIKGSAIIYVRNRRLTQEIAEELQAHNVKAEYFHAGLTSDIKAQRQNDWKEDRCRVMVATNAFGMGIDKPNVRLVIHYELSDSLEEYFQEAGRAGRDGEKAYAVALYTTHDGGLLKRRIKDTFPEKEFIKDVYEKLAYFFEIGISMGANTGHLFTISEFCSAFHYNKNHVHSALKILDLQGYISYIEDTDRHSRLIFLERRDDLYRNGDINSKVDNLLQVLLRSYTGLFSEYVYIDENLLAERATMTVHEAYEGLKLLSAQRIIHYIPARKLPLIYYTCNRQELKHLDITSEVYDDRKERLKNRIEKIIHYATTETICRSKFLLDYFDDKDTSDCGQCDICLSKKKKFLSEKSSEQIIKEIYSLIERKEVSLDELFERLSYPRQEVMKLVRFLNDTKQIILDNNKIRKI